MCFSIKDKYKKWYRTIKPHSVTEELFRITKKGLVKVIVPYFRSPLVFIDPTHTKFFTVESFSYYDPEHAICQRYDYTYARVKIEKILFHENLSSGLIKEIIVKFANN